MMTTEAVIEAIHAIGDELGHVSTVSTLPSGTYVVSCLICGPIAEHDYLAAAFDRATVHQDFRGIAGS